MGIFELSDAGNAVGAAFCGQPHLVTLGVEVGLGVYAADPSVTLK
jgi:hypothetical protein